MRNLRIDEPGFRLDFHGLFGLQTRSSSFRSLLNFEVRRGANAVASLLPLSLNPGFRFHPSLLP